MNAFTLRGRESLKDYDTILSYKKEVVSVISESWQPIFIVGCGRSGTTFLLEILGNYTDFVVLNEPREVWFSSLPEINIWEGS